MGEMKVEASFRKGKVCGFLEDLMALCSKHNASITTATGDTVIQFYNWDSFAALEVDSEGASLYWPRIQTDIVVWRKHESTTVVPEKKAKD